MSIQVSINPEGEKYENFPGGEEQWYTGVIGHVLALVIKLPDGQIELIRDIAVNADSFEDNSIAEATVKTIEAKFNEAFPDPNKPPETKIWVPA